MGRDGWRVGGGAVGPPLAGTCHGMASRPGGRSRRCVMLGSFIRARPIVAARSTARSAGFGAVAGVAPAPPVACPPVAEAHERSHRRSPNAGHQRQGLPVLQLLGPYGSSAKACSSSPVAGVPLLRGPPSVLRSAARVHPHAHMPLSRVGNERGEARATKPTRPEASATAPGCCPIPWPGSSRSPRQRLLAASPGTGAPRALGAVTIRDHPFSGRDCAEWQDGCLA